MKIDTNAIKEIRERTGAGFLDVKKALEAKNGNIEKAIDYLKEQGAAKASKKAGRIATEGLAEIVIDKNTAVIVEVNCETDFVAKNKDFIKLTKDIAKAMLKSKAKTIEEANQEKLGQKTIEKSIVDATVVIGEKLSFRRFEILTKKDSESFGNYIHSGGNIASLLIINREDSEVAKDLSMHVAAMNPTYVSMDDIPKSIIDKEKKFIVDTLPKDKPDNIKEKMAEGKLNKVLGEQTLLGQTFVKDSSMKVSKLLETKKMSVIKLIRFEVGEGIEVEKKDFAQEVAEQLVKK